MNNYPFNPGSHLTPAYRELARFEFMRDDCQKLGSPDKAEHWEYRAAGAKNTLEALTGEWPVAMVINPDNGTVIVYHGDYKAVVTLFN